MANVHLVVLLLDAINLPTRPSGAKEGVLVALGYTKSGERVLLDVCLGQRERQEDRLEMVRSLVRGGLRAPWLSVIDGAPGLINAVEELWPDVVRQRSTVHRLWNVLAKLPKKPEVIAVSAGLTGRRWTRRGRPPTARLGFGRWWVSSNATTAARRHVSLKTYRRCACI